MEGVILAGGQSSRMGKPKELLLIDGVPLIERTWRLLDQVTGHCFILSNHPERLVMFPNDVPIYPDDTMGQGPLGGIVTAMRIAASDILLVVACDMPALSADVLTILCEQAPVLQEKYDIVYPVWNGRAHPLCALYHRRLHSLVKDLLAGGHRRMFDVIDNARAKVWDVTSHFSKDPFCNLNTVQDYEQFQKGGKL
jgi:molybdopterin-guanine dinucleotide biosynthesis protein A